MAISTKITRIDVYDLLNEIPTSISYSTQRMGSGDDAGLSSVPLTLAIAPGILVPSDAANAIDGTIYQRTDITEASGIPLEIRNIANGCWTEAVYTAHEAKLRN